jgi:hypothetical protein
MFLRFVDYGIQGEYLRAGQAGPTGISACLSSRRGRCSLMWSRPGRISDALFIVRNKPRRRHVRSAANFRAASDLGMPHVGHVLQDTKLPHGPTGASVLPLRRGGSSRITRCIALRDGANGNPRDRRALPAMRAPLGRRGTAAIRGGRRPATRLRNGARSSAALAVGSGRRLGAWANLRSRRIVQERGAHPAVSARAGGSRRQRGNDA